MSFRGLKLDHDSNSYSIRKAHENLKYKKKCKFIKKMVKSILFENAALCDEIAYLQEKTLVLMEERNFLFKKLQQFQPAQAAEIELPSRMTLPSSSGENHVKKPSQRKRSDTVDSHRSKSGGGSSKKSSAPVKKKKIVRALPLDSSGRPIFPIVLGDFTVHSLGEVCEKPEYHTEDLIYPVGYCSTRIYGSLKDPEKQCVYTCKVMDGGNSPRFEIVADTDLDVPIVSNCLDRCHSTLLHRINSCLGTEVVNTKGRGAEFFGLSHPAIHQLIQASPGVRRCSKYVWTKFQVNPNHEYVLDDTEASLNFNALLRCIQFSKSMKPELGHAGHTANHQQNFHDLMAHLMIP